MLRAVQNDFKLKREHNLLRKDLATTTHLTGKVSLKSFAKNFLKYLA